MDAAYGKDLEDKRALIEKKEQTITEMIDEKKVTQQTNVILKFQKKNFIRNNQIFMSISLNQGDGLNKPNDHDILT